MKRTRSNKNIQAQEEKYNRRPDDAVSWYHWILFIVGTISSIVCLFCVLISLVRLTVPSLFSSWNIFAEAETTNMINQKSIFSLPVQLNTVLLYVISFVQNLSLAHMWTNVAYHLPVRTSTAESFSTATSLSATCSNFQIPSQSVPVWGSFRPGIYFGLKSRTLARGSGTATSREKAWANLATGIMWSKSAAPQSHYSAFRHDTAQDELSRFEWTRHDGKHFGVEQLIDSSYGLNISASFVIPDVKSVVSDSDSGVNPSPALSSSSPTWLQHIDVRETSPTSDQLSKKSFIFYFGNADMSNSIVGDGGLLSNLSVSTSASESSKTSTIVIQGLSPSTGVVKLFMHLSSENLIVSYCGLRRQDVTGGTERIKLSANENPAFSRNSYTLFDQLGKMKNVIETGSTFIAIQIQFSAALGIRSVYYEGVDEAVANTPSAQAPDANSIVSDIAGEEVSGSAPQVGLELQDVVDRFSGPQSIVDDFDVYMDLHIRCHKELFENKFLNFFSVPATLYLKASIGESEIAKRAISAVLSGIGYFQGQSRVSDGVDEVAVYDPQQGLVIPPVKKRSAAQEGPVFNLLTATPSRTSFPRGFLWDEGFHQLLILQWDVSITAQVLRDWFGCMYSSSNGASDVCVSPEDCLHGWIPREMILGVEATKRVPEEFITQRSNIANPPTFLLVVDSLLSRYLEKSGRQSAGQDGLVVLQLLVDIFPQLHVWIQWFLNSQRSSYVPLSGGPSFRWKGRSLKDNKVIPNTLSSGLDDYPRSTVPTQDEYHVDLHAWMTKSAQIMSRVQTVLLERNASASPGLEAAMAFDYTQLASVLQHSLDELHWSDLHRGYFDVGYNNESSFFLVEMFFRCSSTGAYTSPEQAASTVDVAVPVDYVQSGKPFCPQSHPNVLFPHGDGMGNYKQRERFVHPGNLSLDHIPRVGYVSLFPFLLNLVDAGNVEKMSHVLDMMESPDLLWTEFGLRSIAKTDKFYRKMNSAGDQPYWRGPIWINVNYMALASLFRYRQRLSDSSDGNKLVGKATTKELDKLLQRIDTLYKKLRLNVQRTVLGEYARTGYFWEQYDDLTGAGIRGHPFTGWTALVVNIMAEKYY